MSLEIIVRILDTSKSHQITAVCQSWHTPGCKATGLMKLQLPKGCWQARAQAWGLLIKIRGKWANPNSGMRWHFPTHVSDGGTLDNSHTELSPWLQSHKCCPWHPPALVVPPWVRSRNQLSTHDPITCSKATLLTCAARRPSATAHV